MPSKRTLLTALASLGFIVFFLFSMSVPADAASEEPPFEIRFPQETIATEFSSTFGASRSSGRRHKGNDLMAAKMTEVYAAADGIVVTVDSGRTAGRWVEIEHADGWKTSYMHLNNDNPGRDDGSADWSLTVAEDVVIGAEVHAGQLIGWVGDSGNAEWTGSHTHFELRHNGNAVNPYQLLEDAWRRDYARHVWDVWRIAGPLDLDLMV